MINVPTDDLDLALKQLRATVEDSDLHPEIRRKAAKDLLDIGAKQGGKVRDPITREQLEFIGVTLGEAVRVAERFEESRPARIVGAASTSG